MQGGAKVGIQLGGRVTEVILVLFSHQNNCKPTFAPPCTLDTKVCQTNVLQIISPSLWFVLTLTVCFEEETF